MSYNSRCLSLHKHTGVSWVVMDCFLKPYKVRLVGCGNLKNTEDLKRLYETFRTTELKYAVYTDDYDLLNVLKSFVSYYTVHHTEPVKDPELVIEKFKRYNQELYKELVFKQTDLIFDKPHPLNLLDRVRLEGQTTFPITDALLINPCIQPTAGMTLSVLG